MRILAWAAAIVVGVAALLFVVGTVLIGRLETEQRALEPSDPETSFLETRSGRVHVLDEPALRRLSGQLQT